MNAASVRRKTGLLGAGIAGLVLLAALFGGGHIRSEAAVQVTASLWNTDTVPKIAAADDSRGVELGVRFRPRTNGYIDGIRFYKGAGNAGRHTGELWDAEGALLARVTFTDETGTGWQNATFTTPVPVTANRTYVASYFAPDGHYSATNFYFEKSRSTDQLVAPKDAVGAPNGVYAYGGRSVFPTATYQATNYWVDVTFVSDPTAAPIPRTTTPTTSSDGPTSAPPVVLPPTSTVPVSTTSAPPATTSVPTTIPTTSGPTPAATSWPTAQDTGATGALTPVNGDVILGNANQVYQNMRVNGTIAVTACGVVLRNVEVDAGEPYTGDSTPDLFAIWLQVPENCGTTLDHVSVIADGSPNVYVTEGVRDAYGSAMTVTASKIVGTQLGMTVGPGTIRDSYVLLAPTMRGDHNEDILEDGMSGLTLDHNTFLNPNGQTSALSLFTEFGSNSNLMIEDNLLAGGGYTCYCGDGATDNDGNPARSSDVSFVDNVFWQVYSPTVGQYGPGRAYNPAGGGQWTNNVYMTAGGVLTTQQVPQPAIDQ